MTAREVEGRTLGARTAARTVPVQDFLLSSGGSPCGPSHPSAKPAHGSSVSLLDRMESSSANSGPDLRATIHIGASSVSMLIREPASGDEPGNQVEFLEKPLPLARDIFRRGRISRSTTEHAVEILFGFGESLREVGVDLDQVERAVATNILAEAENVEVFLNRLNIACGLHLEVLDDGEMTRLIYLKTRRRLKDTPSMKTCNTLVGLIREQISGQISQIYYDFEHDDVEDIIVIGYELQLLTPYLTKGHNAKTTLKSLQEFVSEIAEITGEERVQRYQLDYHTADAVVPALETNLAIAEIFNLQSLRIPDSDYERGILGDLPRSPALATGFQAEVIRSARILAQKFKVDAKHAGHVAKLVSRLFEETAELHQLTEHDALLLEVAAILHECGGYVSPRAHHKHSPYLIQNSEIFGLSRPDVLTVSLIARYHRRSGPKTRHADYRSLPGPERIRVSKMAAIMRVADALERAHSQRVRDFSVEITRNKIRLNLIGVTNAAVERLAMQSKGDLFHDVFGLEVVLSEQG